MHGPMYIKNFNFYVTSLFAQTLQRRYISNNIVLKFLADLQ